MKAAIIIIFTALLCATFAVTLEKISLNERIPTALGKGAETLQDIYIVGATPMNWTTGREYCRSLSALDPEKRHHVILETSEEILLVNFKMQEHLIREAWTDGRSDPTGNFYVWYSMNDGKLINVPELEQPCPGEDVFFNGLVLKGNVLSGAHISELHPVICELPTAPTAMSQ